MTMKDVTLIAVAVFVGTLAANLVAAKLVADQVQAQASQTDFLSLLLNTFKKS